MKTLSTVCGLAAVAAEFIQRLGCSQVDLLGWSLGGAVSQQFALVRILDKTTQRIDHRQVGKADVAKLQTTPGKDAHPTLARPIDHGLIVAIEPPGSWV